MSVKNIYWSRKVGEVVKYDTGEVVQKPLSIPAKMSQQEWYQILVTIIAQQEQHSIILTSPDVNTLLEITPSYYPYWGAEVLLEDVFLGPAKRVGSISGKEIWVDSQMDCNILHVFSNKDTFDKDRVSIHVLGMDIY
jgi:hypothetical protein